MIRNHYHYVTPEGREKEIETALRGWLERMTEAPGFRGGCLLREFHHQGHNNLAITIDWESHDAFVAFWQANKQYALAVAQHHDHDGGHGHDHGHGHGSGEAHHHEEMLPEETFHGHYEVTGQFVPLKGAQS